MGVFRKENLLSFASSPPTGTRNLKLTLRYLDQIVGPLVISGALFLAVLTNFLIRRTSLCTFFIGKSHLVLQFGLYKPFRNLV
jgi:hypothetical protein